MNYQSHLLFSMRFAKPKLGSIHSHVLYPRISTADSQNVDALAQKSGRSAFKFIVGDFLNPPFI